MDSNKVMHRRRPEAVLLRPVTSTKDRKAYRVSELSLLLVITGCLIQSDTQWSQIQVIKEQVGIRCILIKEVYK